jgi:hypothetical protein
MIFQILNLYKEKNPTTVNEARSVLINKNKQTGITNATNQIKYTKLLFVLAVKMVIHKISQRSLTHFSIFNIVISMILTTCTSYSFSNCDVNYSQERKVI